MKIYAVVEITRDIWQGLENRKAIYKTDNLLHAYEKLLEEEEELKKLGMVYGGSPLEISFQIDTYLNGEKDEN